MIYLDNAATTYKKPRAVLQAAARTLAQCGSAGRGGHGAAMKAADIIFRCREEAAGLFHVSNPERIVFTFNATHALNIAIATLYRGGGRIVVSGMEHNAVMRPLKYLESLGRAAYTVADTPLFEPGTAVSSFRSLIDRGVTGVICTHVSNVFGYVLPIYEIDRICAEKGIPLVIDASQSAGILPLDIQSLKSDAIVCMPGHKGLYGPQGTGILICSENINMEPVLQGGTGSNSALLEMPDFLPERLEAGTLNTPGIAGLAEGIRYIRQRGLQSIREHDGMLARLAAEKLSEIKGARLFVSDDPELQTGTLSFTVRGKQPEETALQLSENQIAVRAGLHCAPQAHITAGTYPAGTVRVSFSAFSVKKDVDKLAQAVQKIK